MDTNEHLNLAAAFEIAHMNARVCADDRKTYGGWPQAIAAHAINVIDTLREQGLERGYRERAMAEYMLQVERLRRPTRRSRNNYNR
jgi:hypothetical protein